MEVIKKKLQAYKSDRENAIDRAEQAERELREHKARADKVSNQS